jgi:hypothetical protein
LLLGAYLTGETLHVNGGTYQGLHSHGPYNFLPGLKK